MANWSVLKDSIPEFLESAGNKRSSETYFLRSEIDSVLLQLQRSDSQEALYQLACVHRHWDSPLVNRIFFSGLNQLRGKFGDFYIDMLITEFSSAAYIPQKDWQRREIDYAKLLAEGAADIFPEFTSVKREAVFEGFRVDLLAQMPDSGRDVLFELKLGTEDPTPQLQRYAAHFKDPVLIGITEKSLPPRKEQENIYYFTYDMLNCRAAANICRQFSGECKLMNFFSGKFDADFGLKEALIR